MVLFIVLEHDIGSIHGDKILVRFAMEILVFLMSAVEDSLVHMWYEVLRITKSEQLNRDED